MEQRLNIDAITPEISDWTCKVQLVDICRPGEGRERKIKYMNMIFQDAQRNEIKAIVYGDDIPLYQERFNLFCTYLITCARVQQPTLRYKRPLHTYEWIIDKKTIVDPIVKDNPDQTIVDPIDENDSDEDELPPPTIVTMTSFHDISEQVSRSTKEQLKNAEFNVLAIVVNCFPPRYITSMQKRLQELIVIDTNHASPILSMILLPFFAFTFTLWEEAIIKDEGTKLLMQFQKHPVIFARRIGVSKYNGMSLTTKFNTTIQIEPPYTECLELQSWCRFEVALEDASGSITGIIMDHEGEKLLSLTAEEIYAIASTESESQPMQNEQLKMQDNFFKIQVKKSFTRTSRTTSPKVLILSVTTKENMLPSLPAPSNTNIKGDSKRHKRHDISKTQQTTESKERYDMLKQKQKMEPPTPIKMK